MTTTQQKPAGAIEVIDAVIRQTLERGGCPGYGTLAELRGNVSVLIRRAYDAAVVLELADEKNRMARDAARELREALAKVDPPDQEIAPGFWC